MFAHDLSPRDYHNMDLPSPQEVASWLRSHLSEDAALDMLKLAGDTYGWTQQLNKCGLRLLKPNAPDDEQMVSA